MHFPVNVYVSCRWENRISFWIHYPAFSAAYLGKGKCHNPKASNKTMHCLETQPLKKYGSVDCQEKFSIQVRVRIVLFHRVWNMPVRRFSVHAHISLWNRISCLSSTTSFWEKKEVIEYNRLIKSSQTFSLIHPLTQQLFMEDKNAIKMRRILKTRS